MKPARAAQRPAAALRSAPTNAAVAERFEEVATLLHEQRANPFRLRAWRRAADVLRALPRPVERLLAEQGLAGLCALPGIGDTLARAIRDLVTSGRLPMLDRLRGDVDAEALLRTTPGIGRVLARRLHEELGIGTLEALESAAADGRLATLGFGPKRLAGVRAALALRLQRVRRSSGPTADEPPIAELLDVDREYRARAARGELHLIAPRRFNSRREAWLPILHTARGGRHYTALFSNTPRAHRLDRTRDWVVLYCDGDDGDHRYTVVTARSGLDAGRRVVRGREADVEPATGEARPGRDTRERGRLSADLAG